MISLVRMPATQSAEIEQLQAQIAELSALVRNPNNSYNGRVDKFSLPDPIKNMSEFTGNKKELAAWLEELDELYSMYVVKGENGAPDTLPGHYMRAIKNKIKNEARTTLCANGNPNTVPLIKQVLLENYGDQRDLATNLSHLFNMKRGDRSHHKFYADVKELCSKIKMNLTLNPIHINTLIEILTITKYLDNVGEPLASIIRQSKPSTLEQAYQSVCINQNAESRNRSTLQTKPFQRPAGSNKFSESNNGKNTSKFSSKPSQKLPSQQKFHSKAKAEVHHNEIEHEIDETEELEVLNYSDDDDDNSDVNELETNFQSIRVSNQPT